MDHPVENRQIMSHREYVPHSDRFELKFGMHREEGLLMNFPKFHGGRATSSVFALLLQNLSDRPCIIYMRPSSSLEIPSSIEVEHFPVEDKKPTFAHFQPQ